MTVKETVEIVRESALWDSLTIREKAEALAYAMETVRQDLTGGDPGREITEYVGEIFAA